MKTLICAAAICGGFATAAQAQPFGDISVGAGASTLGATVEFSTRLNDRFGLRLPVGYGSFDHKETVDGTPLDGTLRLGGVALLGDYYPGMGGMRISAGLFRANTRASGRADGTFTLSDEEYTGWIDAEVRPENKVSPMISLGYDSRKSSAGWGFSGDIGAIFVGGFSTEVSGYQTSEDASVQDRFEDGLADLRNSIEDDVSDFNVMPYAKLAVTYRF